MASKSIEQIRQEKFDELENQRLAQSSGEVKMIAANKNDKYQISEFDKGHVHVRRVTRVNNPSLMKYDDFEDFQSFGPVFFEQNKDSLSAGYSEFEVIHDPKDEKKVANSKQEDAPESTEAGEAMGKIVQDKTKSQK